MSLWDRTPERRRATAWPAAETAAVAAADEGGGLEPGTLLIQQSNTLGAEIELAAAATIRRVIGSRELTGAQELIACTKYGVPDRNSDPRIGEVVNSIARQKADIALSDPVGIYFDDLATDGWSTPDGSDPKSFWTVERGDTGFPVRAVHEVPAGRGFAVGDITIGGRPIEFGAQIADFVTVRLTATACRLGLSTARPQTACVELAAGADVTPGAFAPGAFSAHGCLGTHPDQASRSTRLVA